MAEPEKIGKYRILDRIGRGGMGTIFKAHDPVLNRPVALKVISTDLDITEEIRARFFREAQACARLSHPNIVTVYDMGDDGGRMFIVMELLEGVELQRLIADRTPLALEDKLAIMRQVCDGLSYAHQRGIVHRDIKPSNIMRLRNGQVKILDFGIAQIENLHETLTRTGLIMGTLRYMAPEQVRGRADHRSDIFSVGAVFYEFLSLRPPFGAKDALHLLEQLRTETPAPLHLVNPTIPPELSDIVAGALRKDPAERVTDLVQMRAQIDQVQRTLAEEARRISERIRTHRDQLGRLRTALASRVGSRDEDASTPIDAPRHVADLQALEADLLARMQAAKRMLAQADALAPAFERGNELLQARQFPEAIAEFERIIADMPEHALAADALAQARAQAEAEQRRRLATQLLQDARAAVAAGEYALCLEIIERAVQIPAPVEAAQDIASLREAAEAAAAARDTAPGVRQQAEDARARMAQARRTAQAQAEVQHAPGLWHEAEASSTGAEAAFARAAYTEAGRAFDAAIAAYRRFEEAGREARRRANDAAQRAREQAALGRQQARVEGAPQLAREQWDAAEAMLAEAQAAFDHDQGGRAAEIFEAALAAYARAGATAHQTGQHEPRPEGADEDRPRIAEAGERAQIPLSSHVEAQEIPGTTVSPDARRVPSGSRRFPGVADDVATRERGSRWTLWGRWALLGLGGPAVIAVVLFASRSPRVPSGSTATSPATAPAPPPVASAPSGGGAGQQEPPRPAPDAAARPDRLPPAGAGGGGAGQQEPPRPAPDAAARPDRLPPAGAGSGRAGQQEPSRPAGDAAALPDRPPPEQLARAGKAEAVKIQPDRPALPPPRGGDQRGAENRPLEGRREAERAGVQLASARREAEKAAAAFYAAKLLATAQAKENEGTAALQRSDYSAATRLLAEARSDYQAAAQEARRAADTERQIAPLRASVERARDMALTQRQRALSAGAERLARDLLVAAETKHAEADGLSGRQSLAAAARAYDEAAARYTEAALRAQAASGTR